MQLKCKATERETREIEFYLRDELYGAALCFDDNDSRDPN